MKETILQKANEMYMTLGFKSVTMDDIANELGISKKTIYQHYANKNELVQASTFYLFEQISDGVDKICDLNKNAIEEIFTIRTFLSRKLNNETTSPFYQLQKFFPQTFFTLHAKQFEKMHGCMLQNIQKGIESGLYRPDINIDFVSRIYFTGLTGIKNTEIFPTEVYEVNALTIQYLEYHLRAISTRKGLDVLIEELKKY
ncbi:TetR/AcrR family transcriptional regulator [Flavobacterium suzhouense]|uniref:TetR/AcrR family transcriptional regulator n=1 Tax=Flavobacterium suzhouense TaxID=1529638 RepID=A0ABW5NR97_9FLAO